MIFFPLSIKKITYISVKNSIIYSIMYSSYLHIWLKVNGMEFSHYLTKLCYCFNIDYWHSKIYFFPFNCFITFHHMKRKHLLIHSSIDGHLYILFFIAFLVFHYCWDLSNIFIIITEIFMYFQFAVLDHLANHSCIISSGDVLFFNDASNIAKL